MRRESRAEVMRCQIKALSASSVETKVAGGQVWAASDFRNEREDLLKEKYAHEQGGGLRP